MAATGSTAWRATRGECDGEAPRLERSDGGGSWSEVQIDAAAIYRLPFTEPSVGFVVGAGESCKPVVFTTGDGGESWQEVAADQTWAPLPKGEALVPGGGRVTVCEESEVVSLAPAGGAAAWAVCDDGRLLRGTSGDAPWEEVSEVSAATSVAAEGGRLLVTSTGEDCDGLLVASGSTDDEALGEPVCVQGARGALAAMTAEGGVLVAERQRWTSTDLTTWAPAA
ncbi:hypothetical protein [Marihabitans asiaticum]|uniref:hypothetical protein n=1 Tax=Marihabitans asiaticum TaxID=415218 RepID=UPI0011A8D267|nr:hypothetical protein [Marihabitans asiaticum]